MTAFAIYYTIMDFSAGVHDVIGTRKNDIDRGCTLWIFQWPLPLGTVPSGFSSGRYR